MIGGEGTERRELETCIAEHGAQEYVTLAGYLEDPRLMLQALDVFVLNSLTEGMPNVVLEAMAMETAVVSTRVAEVPRMIEDHRQGLLVDIANDSQLESAMLETAVSSELRESLGKAGRERVLERYDFKNRVRRVAQVYESVLSSSKNMIA
jgi:glycosyltransferase involved in cell wall biosynthesis